MPALQTPQLALAAPVTRSPGTFRAVAQIALLSCSLAATLACASPTIQSRPAVDLIRKLPADLPFDIGGLYFYEDTLYAATNLGILKIEKSSAPSLLQAAFWENVVEDTWQRPSPKELWFMYSSIDAFLVLGKSCWSRIDIPSIPKDTMRGDLLAGWGLRFTPAGEVIYTFARSFFRLAPDGRSWEPMKAPDGQNSSTMTIDAGTRSYRIQKGKIRPDFTKESDRVFVFGDSQWRPLPCDIPDLSIRRKQVFGDDLLLHTWNDALLVATSTSILNPEAPGPCNASAISPQGVLFAYFIGHGLYEFSKTAGWVRRIPALPEIGPECERVEIAVDGDRVAVATTAITRHVNNRLETFGVSGLWWGTFANLTKIPLK